MQTSRNNNRKGSHLNLCHHAEDKIDKDMLSIWSQLQYVHVESEVAKTFPVLRAINTTLTSISSDENARLVLQISCKYNFTQGTNQKTPYTMNYIHSRFFFAS